MAATMIYYLAWQEDEWLDEILDRFPQVNALVPTTRTLELLKTHRDLGEVERAVIVVNAGDEREKCKEFLRLLQTDERLAADPLYIVGLREAEAERWRAAFPQANIIVITGFAVEFDYESVLKRMEADLEGAV
jgi:hypothetical protein